MTRPAGGVRPAARRHAARRVDVRRAARRCAARRLAARRLGGAALVTGLVALLATVLVGGVRRAAAADVASTAAVTALGDDAGARAAQAVVEMIASGSSSPSSSPSSGAPATAPVSIAVTARLGAGAAAGTGARAAGVTRALEARVVAQVLAKAKPSRGAGKVVALPGADAAAVRQAGHDLWIELELRVDAKAAQVIVDVRVRRVRLAWRDLLARPASTWMRSLAATRPLDAELRRALGIAPPGPRTFARPRRLELDLGAPLLALAAVDLDGDGKAELIALSTDEVVLLEARKNALLPKQRVALPGDAPVPRPRDPVGALLAADLDGDGTPEIVARSSEHAEGVRLAWKAGALVVDAGWRGFPMCALATSPPGALPPVVVGTLALVDGQNVWDGGTWWLELGPKALPIRVLPARVAGVACAAKADGRGDWIAWTEPDGGWSMRDLFDAATVQLTGTGAAFALADLDGDGVPELAASAYRAPGGGDLLTIHGLGGGPGGKKPTELWKSAALSGGIVAVTTGDSDGDGAPDVIFAARLLGSTRTDLWIVR